MRVTHIGTSSADPGLVAGAVEEDTLSCRVPYSSISLKSAFLQMSSNMFSWAFFVEMFSGRPLQILDLSLGQNSSYPLIGHYPKVFDPFCFRG